MAFTVTTINSVPGTGAVQHVIGKYVNDGGSTGGEIVTNLTTIQAFFLQPWGAAVNANQAVVNESFPLLSSTGSVTVVTPADTSGSFLAIGY